MRIVRITVWKLALTSHVTYYMADGKQCGAVDTVVVRLDTDGGVYGFGEVCPIPGYLPAYADGVLPAIAEMAPVLLSAEPVGVGHLMTRLDARLPGHPYAKSAVETALWDITGKVAGLPLYALLGGRQSESAPLYHSLSCMAPEEMARMAREAWATGIRQLQVKLGVDRDWQADVARLRLVRESVGKGPLVYGDFNCGASRLHATRVGRAVADGDFMIEQPCASLEECAAVRRATGLPMKIDEGAFDMASLLRAHRLGCMDAVAVKLSKFGGLGAARRARDLCLYLGAVMCIEDTWGSDITTAAALHLAVATPTTAVLNVCDLSGYVSPRLDENAPTRHEGRLTVSDLPGVGVTPDEDKLGDPIAVFDL